MDYKDRNGEITRISTNQDRFLQRLYGSLSGRMALKLLTMPLISKLSGIFMSSRLSTLMIDPFVRKNKIRMSDYEPCFYHSYNDFFTRKLKKGKRPFSKISSVLVSPSDGKAVAYPIGRDSVFQIKQTKYTVESLLKNRVLANEFIGGYCVIIRLSVDDYHRYCYVADAAKGNNISIPGILHTVNPIALKYTQVYKENSREYTVLQSKTFGKIVQMEVGAMMVGKICNHHQSSMICKGQEKGYFKFGGSSIVLLLQKKKVSVAEDILNNTRDGFETYVKMGESIANAVNV